MRRKVIAGNWKMNNDFKETQNLISKLSSGLSMDNLNCDVIVCPPFTSLSEAYTLLKDTKIKLGAPNMYFESSGAFTGEISATMPRSVGCESVILLMINMGCLFRKILYYNMVEALIPIMQGNSCFKKILMVRWLEGQV